MTSIAADIVPITGENRVLAHFGLKQLNADPRPGLKALLALNKQEKELDINTLVFTIAPRINAAGRIEHGSKAVELLISGTDEATEPDCKLGLLWKVLHHSLEMTYGLMPRLAQTQP